MATAHALTDHDQIREWAESRRATPSCVKSTGGKGDVGMIRLDFPGYSGSGKLQPISWDEWFRAFDENGLALLVQDRTARGQQSNFNKLVARETAEGKQPSRRDAGARVRAPRKTAKASAPRKRQSAKGSSAQRRPATRGSAKSPSARGASGGSRKRTAGR